MTVRSSRWSLTQSSAPHTLDQRVGFGSSNRQFDRPLKKKGGGQGAREGSHLRSKPQSRGFDRFSAVDFFVAAGEEGQCTGKFVERDLADALPT